MGTVHQFPVQRNQTPAATEAVADALGVAIDAAVGADASFEAREAAALALTNEATRVFLERELAAIADVHGTHVEVDGVIYQRHEPGIVRYFTLCGAVDIERWTYREVGMRNGPTLVPLDLDAGLVERTTPALGFRIALGYAKDHMRSCAEDMTADYRCPPSRSTLERVAKAIDRGRGHAGGAPHRTAPAPGGACAGRRRRHLDGPRPHVGAHGGGRPGGRDARDAAQAAAYALHTQEARPP